MLTKTALIAAAAARLVERDGAVRQRDRARAKHHERAAHKSLVCEEKGQLFAKICHEIYAIEPPAASIFFFAIGTAALRR